MFFLVPQFACALFNLLDFVAEVINDMRSVGIGRLYTKGRIIGLDELGQTFVVRLVICF